MQADEKLCSLCKHCDTAGHTEPVGDCRRYPPTWVSPADEEPFVAFPIVALDDVCGEFSRRVM